MLVNDFVIYFVSSAASGHTIVKSEYALISLFSVHEIRRVPPLTISFIYRIAESVSGVFPDLETGTSRYFWFFGKTDPGNNIISDAGTPRDLLPVNSVNRADPASDK